MEKIILKNDTDLLSELEFDFETLEEISDEWVEEEVEAVAEIDYTPEDIDAINSEIADLKNWDWSCLKSLIII